MRLFSSLREKIYSACQSVFWTRANSLCWSLSLEPKIAQVNQSNRRLHKSITIRTWFIYDTEGVTAQYPRVHASALEVYNAWGRRPNVTSLRRVQRANKRSIKVIRFWGFKVMRTMQHLRVQRTEYREQLPCGMQVSVQTSVRVWPSCLLVPRLLVY